jgi:cold shock CspA family protein
VAIGTATTGTVTAFDEAIGLGTVTTADGVVHPFHCTAIADGSRTIAVGVPVRFEVVAGRQGRWEATALAPADQASSD